MVYPNSTGNGTRAGIVAAPREPAGAAHVRAKSRVLLLEDAGILRDGLCALLQSEKGIELVGVAGSRREALQGIAALEPDLLIMDFTVAAKTGPESVTQFKRRRPGMRVLVLTLRRDRQVIEATFRAGAEGFLLKSESRAELARAIQRVVAGKEYLSPSAPGPTLTLSGRSERARETSVAVALTSREQEVIALVARGYRTREMAQLLSLSTKTVEKHRTNLMRKLGLRSAAAVAAYAITHGYV